VRTENNIASLALLLLPQPAVAQLLDNLLPPAIPGYGQKFSVIAQHRQLAPGATGWNIAGLTASPSLAGAAGYDSAPGGGRGSATLQVNPSLLLADPVAGFGLFTEGNFAAYPQDHAQDTGIALAAAGEHIALPRETITLSAAYLHGAMTGFDFDTVAIATPVAFTLENFRARDDITAGLFTLSPEFTLSRYRFAGIARAADRTMPQEDATLAYSSGAPLTALLRLSSSQLNYDLPAQNADIYEILGGAQERQDGLWTFSLLAGAAWRRPRQGASLTTPVLEARADWQPTMLDQLSLTASREIDDPDAISASPYTRSALKFSITHQYLQNLSIQALADLAEAQYVHIDLREFLATAELQLQWQATPALAFAGSYVFNTRQANALAAANEHVVTLGLTWTP
jgi:hypothetical protein